MKDINELKDLAGQIRRDIIRMVYGAQSGHPGGSLGCTEFFTALYFNIMNRAPGFNMDGTGEDIFFSFKWPYFSRLVQHPCKSRVLST